jgi:hypothetical protein
MLKHHGCSWKGEGGCVREDGGWQKLQFKQTVKTKVNKKNKMFQNQIKQKQTKNNLTK